MWDGFGPPATLNCGVANPALAYLGKQRPDVEGKHFDGNGQQNDPEHLAQDPNASFTQVVLDGGEKTQHQEDN